LGHAVLAPFRPVSADRARRKDRLSSIFAALLTKTPFKNGENDENGRAGETTKRVLLERSAGAEYAHSCAHALGCMEERGVLAALRR
jgi:hypothetical protein